MHGTIICGVTGSPDARAAAQAAAALAARLDLRLVLVHVAVHPERAEPLDALAGEWPRAELRIVRGNRVDALARVAADEGADAIVLGSRPSGTRGRLLRCRLARELEAVQGVPVLIAPPATHERTGLRLALAETAASR
jgi:nucleotide-binding universal stress UspA family protein